ncbi:hypothetical protein D3C78_1028640 [compost metagenome]
MGFAGGGFRRFGALAFRSQCILETTDGLALVLQCGVSLGEAPPQFLDALLQGGDLRLVGIALGLGALAQPVGLLQPALQSGILRLVLIERLGQLLRRRTGRCELFLQPAFGHLQVMAACLSGLALRLQRHLLSGGNRLRLLGLLQLRAKLAELAPLAQGGGEVADHRAGERQHGADDDDLGSPLTGLHDHS